jgi:hypothetical protein
MGLFDSLFGPSWAERVAAHMDNRRLTVPERIRRCINDLSPKADLKAITQGLPVTEIRKSLRHLADGEELGHLAAAMHLRKKMRIPVVAMWKKTETQWTISMITDQPRLPVDDGNHYRRFENDGFVIWNPVDDQGHDLAPCPK